MNSVSSTASIITCTCGATADNNTKERKRFTKRHPKACSKRQVFNKQLAQGTRSVEDEPTPFRHGANDEFEEAERDVVIRESYEQTW